MKPAPFNGRPVTRLGVLSRVMVMIVVAIGCAWGTTRVSGQTPTTHSGGPEAAATPRTADGHPDLNGNWEKTDGSGVGAGAYRTGRTEADGKSICIYNCGDVKGTGFGTGRLARDFPKYKPEFQPKVKLLDERQVLEDPALRCRPPGVPRIGPPARIFQLAHEVVFLYDDLSGNFFRVIPLDGRPPRTDTDPSYLGDALGHWEGDTLVVETTNFNDDSWLIDNGAFHTTNLRVVERVRRLGNTLEYQATAHDPEVLSEPFAMTTRRLNLGTHDIVETPPCVDRDMQRIPDLQHHGNQR